MWVELYFICYKLNWSIFFRESAWVGREQADWSNRAVPPLYSSILWLMVIDLTAYTLLFSYQCYKIQQSDSCQLLKFCPVDHLSLHFSCLNITLLWSFGNIFLSFFLIPKKCPSDIFSLRTNVFMVVPGQNILTELLFCHCGRYSHLKGES